MENLLFILLFNISHSMIFGLVTGSIVVFAASLVSICYYILAPRNIFFTFGRENRAVYVMIGKRFTGKVILPSRTIYAGEDYSIKQLGGSSPRQKHFLGMHWIGIYPFYTLHERRQQWLEWKLSDSGGKREIVLRDENTLYLFCKPFEYAMFADEAEDKNGLPLNVYFTVTLMPTNVTLPIFGNENAYGQVLTKCLSQVVLFTKEKTFANLGGENPTSTIVKDEFSKLLRELNDQIPGSPKDDGIKKILGYEITDAKLDKVVIAGDKKEELLDASVVAYIAEEKKKATIFEAEGRKALLDVETNFLERVSKIPGAMKVQERKANPSLTTLVESDSGKNTSLIIGGK